MHMPVLRGVRVNGHAAHRVFHAVNGASVLLVIVTMMVMLCVVLVLRHRRPPGNIPLWGIAIDNYTLWGYESSMQASSKSAQLNNLNRIEGQVRGISRMIEDGRYCIEIVTQISAARAALRRVEEEVLREHIAHCVEKAITSGNAMEQRKVVTELMELLSRAAK